MKKREAKKVILKATIQSDEEEPARLASRFTFKFASRKSLQEFIDLNKERISNDCVAILEDDLTCLANCMTD